MPYWFYLIGGNARLYFPRWDFRPFSSCIPCPFRPKARMPGRVYNRCCVRRRQASVCLQLNDLMQPLVSWKNISSYEINEKMKSVLLCLNAMFVGNFWKVLPFVMYNVKYTITPTNSRQCCVNCTTFIYFILFVSISELSALLD